MQPIATTCRRPRAVALHVAELELTWVQQSSPRLITAFDDLVSNICVSAHLGVQQACILGLDADVWQPVAGDMAQDEVKQLCPPKALRVCRGVGEGVSLIICKQRKHGHNIG